MSGLRRWGGPLLAATVIVEVAVFAQVWSWLGGGWTLGLALAGSVLGGWLMAREGAATWRRLRESARRGQPPGEAAGDVPLVLVGGVLMLLPGFVTDVIGLLLVVPPTRTLARRMLGRRLLAPVVGPPGTGGRGRVIPGEVTPGPGAGATAGQGAGPSTGNPAPPVVWTQIDPRQDSPGKD